MTNASFAIWWPNLELMQVAPSADHALWSLNLVQVTESISGSVVPLAMFNIYADVDAISMTPSRNTRSYTLRSVPSSPGRSFFPLFSLLKISQTGSWQSSWPSLGRRRRPSRGWRLARWASCSWRRGRSPWEQETGSSAALQAGARSRCCFRKTLRYDTLYSPIIDFSDFHSAPLDSSGTPVALNRYNITNATQGQHMQQTNIDIVHVWRKMYVYKHKSPLK